MSVIVRESVDEKGTEKYHAGNRVIQNRDGFYEACTEFAEMAQRSESHFELLRRSLTLYANKEAFISDRQNIKMAISKGDTKMFCLTPTTFVTQKLKVLTSA